MMNKYLKFYESVIEFLKQTDSITKNIAISGNERDIQKIEERIGFKLPDMIYYALKVWGGNGLDFYGYGSVFISKPEIGFINEAITVLENISEIRTKYIFPHLPNIKNILPIRWYDPYGQGVFLFMDCDDDEGRTYELEGILVEEDIYGVPIALDDEEEPEVTDPHAYDVGFSGPGIYHDMPLRKAVKYYFITGINFKDDKKYKYINFSSFEEITWAKFYQYYIENGQKLKIYSPLNKGWDENFIKKMQEREQQTGEILGIEAYEIAYIKYLIE
ncbi:SMI1/KNR4 family protein, partial [Flammeovirga aprica]